MSIKKNVNNLLKTIGLKAEEIKLEQMKLSDGVTIVEADSFEVGQPVFVVAEDQTIALPVGEYTLEDGRVIVVEVEGIIASIVASEPEEEAMPEVAHPAAEATEPQMEMSNDVPAKKTVESIVKETYFTKIEEQAEEIIALKAMIEELKAPKTEVVELAHEEEVKPITFNPESKVEKEVIRFGVKGESRLDRIFKMTQGK